MSFFTDFIEYDFLFNSLIGIVLISLVCGFLSPLIVAKRLAHFMGSALSHSSLLSIALAHFQSSLWIKLFHFFDEYFYHHHFSRGSRHLYLPPKDSN